MKTQVRDSLQAGLVYGLITLFLFLIGFTGTAADLIGKLTNLPASARIANLMIFMGLMGILAGWSGAKRVKGDVDAWGSALWRSTLAGLVQGLMVAALAYIVGSLNAAGVKMSMYLPQVLPEAVHQFLYGLGPLQGALFHLVLMTLSGTLGGALARGLGRGAWRQGFAARWAASWSAFQQLPAVERFHAHPLS